MSYNDRYDDYFEINTIDKQLVRGLSLATRVSCAFRQLDNKNASVELKEKALKFILHSFYKEMEYGSTLTYRIDFAYNVLKKDQMVDNLKNDAKEFLIYAFDLGTNASTDDIDEIMHERVLYKKHNQGYIPGLSPAIHSYNARKTVPVSSLFVNGNYGSKEIPKAIDEKELLEVGAEQKKIDSYYGIKMFTSKDRSCFRVHIRNGCFFKNNREFTTDNMVAHYKQQYAAFTLNTNGELSVFNHRCKEDYVAHSSMNAGVPVYAAGELCIKDGKLEAITTHSGHYMPSLLNVYRLMTYLKERRVDTSETKLITFESLAPWFNGLEPNKITLDGVSGSYYQTNAEDIYAKVKTTLEEKLNESVFDETASSIEDVTKDYKDSRLTRIYKSIDSFIGYDLTEQRAKFVKELETEISDFKQLREHKSLTPQESLIKMKDLLKKVDELKVKNDTLSKKYNKEVGSGRLASKLDFFSSQLYKATTQLDTLPEEVKNNLAIG